MKKHHQLQTIKEMSNLKTADLHLVQVPSPKFGIIWAIRMVAILALFLGSLPAVTLHAQSLDDAIADLLDNRESDVCFKLESAGARLGGALGAFCSQSGGGDPASSGGGAGAPQTAPGIVQERLQAARGDKEQASQAENSTVSELGAGWSLFVSAEYENLDRDVTTFEDGYDSDVGRFTVGSDYRLSNAVTAGVALTYATHDGDFDGGGDFENDSYGFTLFASYLPNDKMFLQGTMGYAAKSYDRTRSVSASLTSTENPLGPGSVNGDYDGSEFSTGLLWGYDHTSGNLTIGPRLGLDWIYTQFDDYTETGDTGLELVFDDTDETSLQSRVGLAASMAMGTGFGVLIPQVSADWVHEFANDQRTEAFSFADDAAGINFAYQDEDPDRDFFEWAVGLSAVLPNGWLPYAQFRAIAGHEYLDSYVGVLGLRIEL